MKNIKLFHKQKQQTVRKTVVFLLFSLPSILFYSCSDDKEEQTNAGNYSVTIGSNNLNMPSGGIITSQYDDSPSGSDIGKTVDNDIHTKFITYHNEFYIHWSGNKSVDVNYYSLISAEDAPECDPRSWALYGSTDNTKWELLDTQTDQTFTERNGKKEYFFENTTSYNYYRLDIKSNRGGASTQIAEFTLQNVVDPSAPYTVTISNSNKNLPGSGVITSQYGDFPSGSDIEKAVDNNIQTVFITYHPEFYIMWQGDKKTAVNFYSLTSGDDDPENDPESWSLYGSVNQEEWVLLDKKEGQTFGERYETKGYFFQNETEYQFYKIEIENNHGGNSTQIAELTLQNAVDPTAPYSVILTATTWNMPSAGKITAQYGDFPSGSDIGKAVDNKLDTKFITSHSTFYILWEGVNESAIDYYALASADDAPENDPKAWTLYGSNDQQQWIILDKRVEEVFTERHQNKPFYIENKTKYRYYKLEIEDNHGGEATHIAELFLLELPKDFDDLMSYAEGHSNSSLTPMGNHYANRHKTTAEDRIWLNTAENEPEVPGSASHLHLAEFDVDLYPFGEPLPADINQHAIGDCSALAVFASMAYIYPEFVKTLIKDNGDKTYTVSMFDPQGEPVRITVTSKFLAESDGTTLGAVSGKNNRATWATVLEKAIMKWNCIYKVNTDIGGIGSEHVAPLFTGDGNSFAFYPGKLNAVQMARVAKVCVAQGKIIVGGFNKGDLPVDGTVTVTGHAWTIMHSTDPTALFTMRNPWGGNYHAPAERDGVINIPDNNTIPSTIDFRIIEPGIASKYGTGTYKAYIPPYFSAAQNSIRVADYLLNP